MSISIDHIVDTLRQAKEHDRGCVLLVGAGCSVKAGIPTAAGFVDIIKKKHGQAYEDAGEKTYAECMAKLAPGQRRDLIGKYIDEAKINWAHIGIAQLMKQGYVDRVLTTNFDPLVARACALVGLFPAVYDFASSQVFKAADTLEQAVFYLHGQRSGFRLLNTKKEMDSLSKALKPLFRDAGSGRTWIVVGYSGENDPVYDLLANVPRVRPTFILDWLSR